VFKEEEKRMSYSGYTCGRVNDEKAKSDMLWHKVIAYSGELIEVLRLDEYDLQVLKKGDGRQSAIIFPTLDDCIVAYEFLAVVIDGEKFVLFCRDVCGAPYGAPWVNLIMAACTSNGAINAMAGEGARCINALSDEWHKKLIRLLEKQSTAPMWMPDEFKRYW
jgi:hypothetical protein